MRTYVHAVLLHVTVHPYVSVVVTNVHTYVHMYGASHFLSPAYG